MTVSIEEVHEASATLLGSLNKLLPQLSASALPLTMDELERMVSADATTVFVARDDDAIIGTLSLVIFTTPSGTRAWVEDVVVDDDARGLGAGELLTRAAIEHAALLGVRTIDLTSRPSRVAANALYEKVGFQRRETNVYRFFLEDR